MKKEEFFNRLNEKAHEITMEYLNGAERNDITYEEMKEALIEVAEFVYNEYENELNSNSNSNGITIYQPELKYGDEMLPKELYSFEVFTNPNDADVFMQELGYSKGQYIIKSYTTDDIEDFTIVDLK